MEREPGRPRSGSLKRLGGAMSETVPNTDDLIARAKERAEGPPVPEEWGYRVTLEEGESFVGRWRERTVDVDNEDRPIYLLWDAEGAECFSRHYASLERELTREDPTTGATVVIYRAENYKTQYDDEGEQSGQSYGVTTEPNDAPLPDEPPAATDAPAKAGGQAADDEDFPY
jgi:hypothetical protein